MLLLLAYIGLSSILKSNSSFFLLAVESCLDSAILSAISLSLLCSLLWRHVSRNATMMMATPPPEATPTMTNVWEEEPESESEVEDWEGVGLT